MPSVLRKLTFPCSFLYSLGKILSNLIFSDQLMQYYETDDGGLWGKDLWWQSGNFMSSIATLSSLNSGFLSQYGDVFGNTYQVAPQYGNNANFISGFYDDEGWWGNAWLDVYDVTQEQTYLDAAITIYNDMVGGLGTPCGGIWWDKPHTYVSAISNGKLARHLNWH
jgi:hypothetical protein